jgi:hypothetical protein
MIQQYGIDSGTTHTILIEKKYFQNINASRRPIITGQNYIEKGHEPATIKLPKGRAIHIQSPIYAPSATRNILSFISNIQYAIYAPSATHNLLSFKDIKSNNLHIQTAAHLSR